MSTDGVRLRALRSAVKLSARKFADQIGVSQSFISHIENGHKDMSDTILRGILKEYPDVNPYWLLLGSGGMFTDGSRLHRIEVLDTSTIGHAQEERPAFGRRWVMLPGMSGESHAAFVVLGLSGYAGEVILVCRSVPATAVVPGAVMVVTTSEGYYAGQFFWDTSGSVIIALASGERITLARKAVTGYYTPEKVVSDFVP